MPTPEHFNDSIMRIPTVFFAAAFLATFSASAQTPDRLPNTEYHVQAGDVLEISVWKEEDLTKVVLVRPDGRFSFPLVGDIIATGKTIEAVRQELIDKLSVYIPDLVVTVSIEEILGNKIYVLGQVNNPGQFIVNPSVDVMQALSMAGGTTAFAALNDIIILRRAGGMNRAIPFRYADVARGRDLEQNIILESGDVLVVP